MSDFRLLERLKKKIGDYDNFYIIKKRCKTALINQKHGKNSKYLYDTLYNMLEDNNYDIDYNTLETTLKDAQRDYYFGNDEICSVNDYIAILILRKLSNADSDLMEKCVKTLRFIDIYDFEELYSSVSYIERLLSDDPGGVYNQCDVNTKNMYRANIDKYAKKHNITQIEASRIMSVSAGKPTEHKILRRLYFPLVYGLTFVLFIISAYLLRNNLLIPIFLLLPLSELSKSICDFIIGKFVPAERLPKLKINSVPDNAKTLVIITSLLLGEGKDDGLFERLEHFYLSNQDENLRFGILGDLKDNAEIITDNDEKIISYAVKKINSLNDKYSDGEVNPFCLFTRSRSYSASERRYMGWERKRGAVIELTRHIKDIDTSINVSIIDKYFLSDIKYIVTLDADTNLYIGAVKEMLGAMLHPINKPTVENGIVKSGYAIMQPRMDTTVESASRTPFSVMMTGSGGIDIYASAAFDIYQTLFAEGIFCGKGIFNVDIFYNLLDKAFPEDSILSHDLLEGTRLRAGYLSDISLTDGCPKNPIAHYGRLHRWIRGDIQALDFAGKSVKNHSGESVINPITALSKYKLFDNLRRILTPISAAVTLIIAPFLGKSGAFITLIFALSYLLFPMLISFISAAANCSRKFYSFVLPGIWRTMCMTLYNISSLIYLAYISADAVLRSFIRIKLTRKHTLEWVTASEHDFMKPDGIWLYIIKMILSVVIGTAFFIFAPYGAFKILGIMWTLFPVVSYLSGREKKSAETKLSDNQRDTLTQYALDMWNYYADLVTENDNWLPPDNYQQSPVEIVAHRTSPTNIGLYLLSCLAAHDFGFIDTDELYERLDNSLDTVNKLIKWNGHLYNWYDTETLNILGTPYISTVDSGNFITSVEALKEGLRQYDNRFSDIISALERLISNTDFKLLYCEKRNLFYIGYDTLNKTYGNNCYDLFMSESRTISYYAVAKGIIPKEHWGKLGRILISKDGYIGIISWTGTMFEYFMPPLLLPVYKNSLIYEALHFAVEVQYENSFKRLWGKSESGYFAFDAEMNYQYKAFGTQKLGLKSGLDSEIVIAPYSSFLTLSVKKKASLMNLKRLDEFGMYGKYGFYEAIDFTPSRVGSGNAVIHSYMAHHIGMSIIAAANACFENIFNKRFMANPQMASAKELLQEKIPVDAVIYKNTDREKSNPTPRYNSRNSLNKTFSTSVTERNSFSPKVAVISNNKTKITASSYGHIYLSDGKIALTNPNFTVNDYTRTLHLMFKADGDVYNITHYDFTYSVDSVTYKMNLSDKNLKAAASLSVYGTMSCYNINLTVDGRFKNICPLLVFDPVLACPNDYSAHPAFSDLSVEAFYIKDENIILYKRRPRLDHESEMWLAVTLESTGGNVEFETRKDELYPLMYDESDIEKIFTRTLSCNTGACINPVCAVKKQSHTNNGKYECDFLIAFAKSKNDAVDIIRKIRLRKKNKYRYDFKQSISKVAENQLFTANMPVDELKYAELITSAICYKLNDTNELKSPAEPALYWKYGISGDIPIVSVILSSEFTDHLDDKNNVGKIVRSMINAHRYLVIKGFRYDFAIVYSEAVKYNQPIKNYILKIIRNCGSEFLINQKGGVHILNTPEDIDLFKSCSELAVNVDDNTVFDNIYYDYMMSKKLPEPEKLITEIQNQLHETKPGYFTDNSYTIIKGRQRAPWTFVYANKTFGTLVSQNSLGFTWFDNSREKRITPWSNDILRDNHGERLIITIDDSRYDMCAVSNKVEYTTGSAVYYGNINGAEYKISVSVDVNLSVKLIHVELSDKHDVEFIIEPVIGFECKYLHMIKCDTADDTVFYKNYYTASLKDLTVFKKSVKFNDTSYGFMLGCYSDEIINKYRIADDFINGMSEYRNQVNSLFGKIQISTGIEPLDKMMNFYLPYQAIYVRMFARSGFYQSSGAFGFRDQLQDSLAALYLDSSLTREQILKCAAHQYIQGDVQHWWHNTNGEPGVRTQCSDDYLWLAYVTALYTEYTGDYDILDISVPYIESDPLGEDEIERYEIPKVSSYSETIYMHCVRAIEYGFKFGRNGLPLIGNSDWNDGLSRVGVKGKGESVWLGWFLKIVIGKFIPLCKMRGDIDCIDKYYDVMKNITDGIENNCWDGEWYLRAFCDDGRRLGSKNNTECKIDILPQTFAAISEGANERIKTALDNAYMYLYDTKYKLFKLFTPPFNRTQKNSVGYIEGYVPGIRENGGQYSHAAVWAGIGFIRAGDVERGFDILNSINPAMRCEDQELQDIYRIEPYAFAGDVYTNPDHYGRGGWSQYTGAAAWYYRAVIEEVLGYKVHGDYFTLSPKLNSKLQSYSLRINHLNTKYEINVKYGDTNSCILDGKNVNNKFYFDKTNHFLEITVEK